ncbi:MAG: hypothetical protein SH848_11195 [Saprospiraceae bacterium]|nr:hypothetical protein [Saprospiraceae bacterium]MDZ4704487.1 hypothetical protein [Saprospiraceae bacterium]
MYEISKINFTYFGILFFLSKKIHLRFLILGYASQFPLAPRRQLSEVEAPPRVSYSSGFTRIKHRQTGRGGDSLRAWHLESVAILINEGKTWREQDTRQMTAQKTGSRIAKIETTPAALGRRDVASISAKLTT